MAYDPEFYRLYEAYQQEPIVRANHDRMFTFASTLGFEHVLDLGCGQYNEYLKHGKCKSYRGIDQNADPLLLATAKTMQGDYRDLCEVRKLLGSWEPTAFISLFSSEIMRPREENERFYEQVFDSFPAAEHALVSGFYYWNRKDQNPVTEEGGLTSYQTLSVLEEDFSKVFGETRITVHTPSFFGQDVIEVWRFLERK